MESLHDSSATSFPANLTEEHCKLVIMLKDVERSLRRHDRTQRLVEREIWNLADFVESHFLREENGGYRADALARSPTLAAQAERLLAEHADLLDATKKLQILARSGVETTAWWRQIEGDFTQLQGRLLAHEQAENQLLHRAFGETDGEVAEDRPRGREASAVPGVRIRTKE